MTGLTYSTLKTQLATMAVVAEDDPNFLIVLPQAITYAELRMQRDIDFLNTTLSRTVTISPGSRQFNIADGNPFVVTEQVNVILPAGVIDPDQGERQPLTPITKEYLDAVWGSSSTRGVPEYYAPLDDEIIIVGPFADNNYTLEVVGTVRFSTLSGTNTSNFISEQLPDLLVMACMIYLSAYQRNFGRMSDDPQMGMSYEAQYQALLKSAVVEESRKKYESAAWSSQAPSITATPAR